MSSKENTPGSYDPSPFTLFMGTSKKSDYKEVALETTYSGDEKILVVCTDDGKLAMANGKVFNTGNHPVEMLVPMIHMKKAGFSFDLVTISGSAVVLEEWAYPTADKEVIELHDSIRDMMESPKKVSDIKSLDGYCAVFIPGGHGAMVNLPYSADLGRILREAHAGSIPTVTLCHGPAALLSAGGSNFADVKEAADGPFLYDGYSSVCFTDKTDGFTPSVGYLPGQMPWKCQGSLESNGMTITNTKETGGTYVDRELITGDSPGAANNLGTVATPLLVKFANSRL